MWLGCRGCVLATGSLLLPMPDSQKKDAEAVGARMARFLEPIVLQELKARGRHSSGCLALAALPNRSSRAAASLQEHLSLGSIPDSDVTVLHAQDLELRFGVIRCRVSPGARCVGGSQGPLVWELTASGLLHPEDEALRPVVCSTATGRAIPVTVTRLEPVKDGETSARFRVEVSRSAVGSLDALEMSMGCWSQQEDHLECVLGEPALAVVLPDAAACAQANACPAELLSDLHALVTVASGSGAVQGLGSWIEVLEHVAGFCRTRGHTALESLVRGEVQSLLVSERSLKAKASGSAGSFQTFYRQRRSLHFWTPLLAQTLVWIHTWILGGWRGLLQPGWQILAAAHALNVGLVLGRSKWQPVLQPVGGIPRAVRCSASCCPVGDSCFM